MGAFFSMLFGNSPAVTSLAPVVTDPPTSAPVITSAPVVPDPPTAAPFTPIATVAATVAPFTNAPVAAGPPTLVNQPLKWSNDSGNYTRYLDCDGGACSNPANKVQAWQPTGAGGQNWTWRNGGMYSGGEVLATYLNGLTNGTPIVATTDSGAGGTGGQEWRWQQHPSGQGWQLKNPWSGRCLDVAGGADANGSQVQLSDCNTSSSHWQAGP